MAHTLRARPGESRAIVRARRKLAAVTRRDRRRESIGQTSVAVEFAQATGQVTLAELIAAAELQATGFSA